MALPSSAISPYSFRSNLFNHPTCQFHSSVQKCIWKLPPPAKCSVKLATMAQFHQPPKLKMFVNNVKEKLWEVVPTSVKDFPWKKAEAIALQQVLLVGQEALKWSLLALFALSFTSDVIYSISRNKELMIPFGLFLGCMMTDILKETSQELFRNLEFSDWQQRGLNRQLLIIGCFFVLVKIIFTYFLVRGQVFLLHVANGGLMQVLWLWRSSLEEQNADERENSLL